MLIISNLLTVLFLFANCTFAYVRFSREVQYSPRESYSKVLAKPCELKYPAYNSENEKWKGSYSYEDYVIPLENDLYLGTIIFDCDHPDQFNETSEIKVMTFNSTIVYRANDIAGTPSRDLCHWKSQFFFKAMQSINDPDTLCMADGHQIQFDTKNGSYDPNFGCSVVRDSKKHIPKLCFKRPQIDPPKLLVPPTSFTESELVSSVSFVTSETVPLTFSKPPIFSNPPRTKSSIFPTPFEPLFPSGSTDPPEIVSSTSVTRPELEIPPVISFPTKPADPLSKSSSLHNDVPPSSSIPSEPILLTTSTASKPIISSSISDQPSSTSFQTYEQTPSTFSHTSRKTPPTSYTSTFGISSLSKFSSLDLLSSSTKSSSVQTPNIKTLFSTTKQLFTSTDPSTSNEKYEYFSTSSSINNDSNTIVKTTLVSRIYTTDIVVCTTTETIPITITTIVSTTFENTSVTTIPLVFTTPSTVTSTFTTTTTYCVTQSVLAITDGTQTTSIFYNIPIRILTSTNVEPAELSLSISATLPLNDVSIYIAGTKRNYPVGYFIMLVAVIFL